MVEEQEDRSWTEDRIDNARWRRGRSGDEEEMKLLDEIESTYLTMTLVSVTLVLIALVSGTLASLVAETMAVSLLALWGSDNKV